MPQAQGQFANACSVSYTVGFNNCDRLAICQNAGGTIPDTLVAPANLGTAPAPVNPQPPPMIPCEHPSRPNVIYATGSTNLLPLLKAVAPLLAADDPAFTVVYQPQTSCKGAGSMFETDPAKRIIKDVPNNWAFFYDAAGAKNYCTLNPAGNAVDIGESDVYARTCGYDSKAGVADYPGPIQAITFVVPAASSQQSISAEAAHFLFGAGGNMGRVPPWTDPRLYFVRSAGTGTVQLISRAINVPAAVWW